LLYVIFSVSSFRPGIATFLIITISLQNGMQLFTSFRLETITTEIKF
jgi:hypothetical protein